jgi:hypothetical protein
MADLRELIKKWRSENGDYPESKKDCADELERALAAQPAPADLTDDEADRIAAEVELAVGAGCESWDLVPPSDIIRAVCRAIRPAPAAAAVPEGWALVDRAEIVGMARLLERDGDEFGVAADLRRMLSAAPQPATCNQPLQVQPEAGADDCTPYASPAYLRGESDGVRGACARITDALEGRDSGRGVFGDADLETLRRRVLSLQAQPKPAEGGAVVSDYCRVTGCVHSAHGCPTWPAGSNPFAPAGPAADAELLRRALPFLRDEAARYDDDGSNEPLELARDIESALALAGDGGA